MFIQVKSKQTRQFDVFFSKVNEKREKLILTNFNKKKIVKSTVHSCKIKTNMTF